MSKVKTLY